MKKIIFLILIGFLIFPNIILADYPIIGGININDPDTTASQFITYLFYIITAIGSFLGVVLLIIAGLEWVSAYGDAKVINSAKRKIAAVFTGLAVLFTSYIIINTINPAILNVNIDDISNDYTPIEFVIPEGKGIFLYSEINYETEKDPLNIKSSRASLISDSFYRKTSSIKINQPDDMTLGAILFADREDDDGKVITGTEFRGSCAYLTNSISNLDNASGDQNNPPIGQNTLASIIVFAGRTGGDITIYNNYNCKPKINKYCREAEESDDDWEEPYPCPPPEEYSCNFRVNEFESIDKILEENCQSEDAGFEGDVLSIAFSGRIGVLLRGQLIDGEDEVEETCQYIDSKNTTCINMIKYGPFYRTVDGERRSIFSPEEIMIFSLD